MRLELHVGSVFSDSEAAFSALQTHLRCSISDSEKACHFTNCCHEQWSAGILEALGVGKRPHALNYNIVPCCVETKQQAAPVLALQTVAEELRSRLPKRDHVPCRDSGVSEFQIYTSRSIW